MVKWSKSLVKILIFRNVSTFTNVEELGNTLNVTTLSDLENAFQNCVRPQFF